MDWKGKVRQERGCEGTCSKSNKTETPGWRFSLPISAGMAISVDLQETEVSRAWNSFCNQDPDARQVVKLPLPHIPPSRHAACLRTVCQPPPDTRRTYHSRSRLKPSAWARKAKYIVVGKSWRGGGGGGVNLASAEDRATV